MFSFKCSSLVWRGPGRKEHEIYAVAFPFPPGDPLHKWKYEITRWFFKVFGFWMLLIYTSFHNKITFTL